MTSNDEYVLQLLREKGYVTAEQLDVASKAMREGDETTLDVLVASGALSEDDVLGTIADTFGIKYVSIDPAGIDPEVGKEIAPEIAHKYGVAPVMADADSVTVVLSDPMGYDAVDSLRYVLHGKDVQAVLAPSEEVKAVMERLYPTGADQVTTRNDDGYGGDESASGDDAPVIRLSTMILSNAIKMKASDIHLEPMEKEFRVRYRIDGALRKMDSPPKRLQGAIISRIKIMSKIKISEKRIPQDGRIQVNVGGRDLDLRVSTVPTNHGESIVMRILDKSNLSLGLPQLGFLSDDQTTFERLIKLPDGVVLVTGPTGSGKTTTLYACLGQINTPDKKLITVEDPVEYQMSGINQVQVNKDVGLDFSAALRSILRQAPNIVMIGEIRDRETASIAVQASITGHLVVSTLHTNDTASSVTRLLDMGVESYLIADALTGIIAQRLVRRLCPNCKRRHVFLEHELEYLELTPEEKDSAEVYEPVGCQRCAGTGYFDRIGIYEIMEITPRMRTMISHRCDTGTLRETAIAEGMHTLRESARRLVLEGTTSISEMQRISVENMAEETQPLEDGA